MANNINKIPIASSSRSKINLTHNHHFTLDFGRIQNLCNLEVCPNDDIVINLQGFLRAAPMPAPTFGSFRIDVRAFFVPNRILTYKSSRVSETSFSWSDWISGISSVSHPYTTAKALQDGINIFIATYPQMERDIWRHLASFGLPLIEDGDALNLRDEQRINPFVFQAYNRIWWDWYRDSVMIEESLLDQYVPEFHSGLVQAQYIDRYGFLPRYCCFPKDYFTTAKINPQSGMASAGVGYAHDSGQNNPQASLVSYNPQNVQNSSGSIVSLPGGLNIPVQWLRASNSLQLYLERNNLAGTRLRERFLARFGVAPSEAILDMSEYLGGSRNYLRIGDVTANLDNGVTLDPENAFNYSLNDGVSPSPTIMGQVAGKGSSDFGSGVIKYHAKEFGNLLVLGTIVPDRLSYTQGISKALTRGTDNDKFAYLTPEMQNLGYEPVKKSELFGSATGDFGFNPRYSSYKVKQDVVSGDLVLAGTRVGMDCLYLSREFDSAEPPSLSQEFTEISVEARHELDRVFSIVGNVGQFDHFQGISHNEIHVERDLSSVALPSLEPDSNGKVVDLQNGGVRM